MAVTGNKQIETKTQGVIISEEDVARLRAYANLSKDVRDALDSAASTVGVSEEAFREIKELLEDIHDESDEVFDRLDDTVDDSLAKLRDILLDNKELLSGTRDILNQSRSITNKLYTSNLQITQLRESGQLITENTYKAELKKLEILEIQTKGIIAHNNLSQDQKENLVETILGYEKLKQTLDENKLKLQSSRNLTDEQEKSLQRSIKWTTARLRNQREQYDLAKANLGVLEAEEAALKLQNDLLHEMNVSRQTEDQAKGVVGNTYLKTKGLKALGLGDIAEKEQRASDTAKVSMKSTYQLAKDAGKSDEEAWALARKSGEDTYKALKPKWDDLGKSLKNAAISWLLANIIKQFNEVDDLAAKLKQNIGTWEHSAAAANLQFATSKDYLQAALDIAEKFYINPSVIFTSEEMGKIAEAKNLLGLSSAEASNLAMYSKAVGVSAEQYKSSVEAGFKNYNGLSKTAVNHGQVLRETLRTSDAIRLSVGGTGKGLAEAAAAALSIGMNLEQVQRIAQSLINFESSIESEMTAQLLTGQQMNLAKARELALNNDLEGVVREISHQGVDMVKFGQWNYIQQENFAKALGMSRDELAKMLIMQGIQNGLSEEQIAANMKIRKEEIHAMSTMQEWKVATEKLIQSVTPFVKVLATILDIISTTITKVSGFIGWIASGFGLFGKASDWISKITNGLIIGLTLALPLIGKVATGVRGIITAYSTGFSTIKSAWIGLVAFIRKRPLVPTEGPVFSGGRWRDAATGRFVKAPVSAAPTASMSSTAAAGGAKATGTMSKTVGGLGKNMGNLLKGAAAAAILAGAVFVLVKACQEFAKIDSLGKALLGATVGLGILVGAVALLGMVMTSGVGAVAIIAGAAAMLVVAGAVWLLGKALQEIQSVEWETIGKLPVAMLALLGAGLIAIPAGLALLAGAGLLALAGLALIGVGISLGIAAGLFALVGEPIMNTLEQLSSIDYGKFLSGAGALALFGLALIPFGLGLLAATVPLWLFPTREFGKIIDHIAKLKGLELRGMGSAFTGLASGITALASAVRNLDTDKLAALSDLKSALTKIEVDRTVEIVTEPVRTQVRVPAGQIEAAESRATVAQAKTEEVQRTETQQVSIDLSNVEEKLGQLLAAVKEGKNIYLNGDKVGQTLAWSTTSM